MSDLLKTDRSLPSICNEKLLDIVILGTRRFNAKTNQNILMYALIWNLSKIRTDSTTCFPLELFFLFLILFGYSVG